MYSRHFFEDLTVDEAVQQNANDAGGTCTRLRGGGCYENLVGTNSFSGRHFR